MDIEKRIQQIDLRLKKVEAYIDAFDKHNQHILQWVKNKEKEACINDEKIQ